MAEPTLNAEGGLDISGLMDRATRKRKNAKERIAEQFAEELHRYGVVFVDCGPELGHAIVRRDEVGCHVIEWLNQKQVRTLAGRID